MHGKKNHLCILVRSELTPRLQVRADLDMVWERLFEMTTDESAMVRDQALHALGDGSPRHLEDRVVEVIERMYNDPDASVRKKARRMLNSYRHTGKWNVL